MSDQPLRRRLIGFMMVPALSAVSPLLVLPLISRIAGPGGWASAIAGESIGTFAAIAIGYGWTAIGPALISIAADDARRARLYRDSIVVRLLVAVIALPILGVVCWLVASPGAEWLTVLMGTQGALIALSFTWYCAGVGDFRTIIAYDSIPRLLAAAAAAAAIAATGVVELFPLAGIAVTLVGTGIFTVRLLRRTPGLWPTVREVPGLLRVGFPVALNDAALGAYSSVPAPLVNVTAAPAEAAGFASADKMFKLGAVLPFTLASAFQSWVGEETGAAHRRRLHIALATHAAFGVLGAVVLAGAGYWVSLFLFGTDAAAGIDILLAMGVVFAFLSIRTSMTRHVLFPAGQAKVVMRATLIASVLGVPVMIVLAILIGPVGAAIGFAVTEGVATVLLWAPCAAALRALHPTTTSHYEKDHGHTDG
jgi:PST family polysaccharide transporter